MEEFERASDANVQILSFFCSSYPQKLKELKQPPLLLWAKGDLTLLERKSIGIVGTRNATLYGKESARSFAREGARRGALIISGLARGIDTEAHLGALEGGKTVAIIGSGQSSIYPDENIPLAKRIATEGLLLSEYPMKTPPNRYQFPERNRLIAALSDQLLVIEAPLKSGSLLTVHESFLLKRPVFALPGRIDFPNFAGNHQLLKEGKSKIATTVDDLISGESLPISKETDPFLSLFGETEQDVEALLNSSGLPLSTLNAQLMRLVLQGKIRELPGKIYKKR